MVQVMGELCTAAGPHCSRHTRAVLPGMLVALGDSKVRVSSLFFGFLFIFSTK